MPRAAVGTPQGPAQEEVFPCTTSVAVPAGIGRPPRSRTPAERSVLHAVIEAYPELFTERELAREIASDPDDFMERDAVERAVQALAALALIHRVPPLIVPGRAALRFDALEELSER
jgi:hypothetical protein